MTQPEDNILSRFELATIFFRRMAIRMESVRQSEQSIAIVKSADFTLGNNEDSKDLTAFADDFVIPMWVERQIVDITGSQPVWQFVPTVALARLAACRAEAYPACAFSGENSLEVTVRFSYYGNETATPSRIHRVWYSPTVPLPGSESDTVSLPDNLVQMISLDCMVSALPLMIAKASLQMKKMPEYKDIIQGWEVLLASHTRERAEFEKWFNQWRKESRGSHRARRRRDVLRRDANAGNIIFGATGGQS